MVVQLPARSQETGVGFWPEEALQLRWLDLHRLLFQFKFVTGDDVIPLIQVFLDGTTRDQPNDKEKNAYFQYNPVQRRAVVMKAKVRKEQMMLQDVGYTYYPRSVDFSFVNPLPKSGGLNARQKVFPDFYEINGPD